MKRKPGVVNLNDGELLEPLEYLSDSWRSLQLVKLDPEATRALVSDEVEHALYVTAGEGTARTDGGPIALEAGVALTAPKGTSLELRAGASGLTYFHAVLVIPSP